MDIPCRKCGEPWDADSLHEEVEARGFGHLRGEAYQVEYRKVSADFRKRGCVAVGAASAIRPRRGATN
jgi:hypothetical protein